MLKRLMPKWVREYRVVAREALVDGWRYQRATGSRERHTVRTRPRTVTRRG